MNFYCLHIGDYASDTAHLSWQEDLAYRRLLDLYYLREQPLSGDLKALCRLLRAREPELEAAVHAVLDEFFVPGPEGWRHKRCDAEIAQYVLKRGNAVRAARRRWGAEEEHDLFAHAVDATGGASGGAPGASSAPAHMTPAAREAGAAAPDPAAATTAPCDAAARPGKAAAVRGSGGSGGSGSNGSSDADNAGAAGGPAATRARSAGEACRLMRAAGIRAVNPSHPDLLALLDAGAVPQAFADLAREIVARHQSKPMPYLLTVMRNRRAQPATRLAAPGTRPAAPGKWPAAPAAMRTEEPHARDAVESI